MTVMALMFVVPQDSDAIVLGEGDLSAGFSVGEEWMGAYLDGRKLGYLHSVTRRESGRLHLSQESRLAIEVGGLRQKVDTDLRVVLGQRFHLERFDFDLRSGILDLGMRGWMEGNRLVVEVNAKGQTSRKSWPLEEPPLFDLAIPKLLAQRNLKAGQRYQVTLFDPQTLSNQPSVISVVGREAVPVQGVLVPAVRLKRRPAVSSAGGISMETWISEQGEVLKQESEIGLVLRREDRERAMFTGSGPGPAVPVDDLLEKLVPGRGGTGGTGTGTEDSGK